MDNSFARVKSIINRLREVLKCQKCLQLKEEGEMMFYHICDHLYCCDCLGDNKNCLICGNPLDKPTKVTDDKNILSLYQSLFKFELPSKEDVEKIYKIVKESKEEKSKNNSNRLYCNEEKIQETPKNQTRGSKKNVTPESAGGESSVLVISGSEKQITTPARRNKTPVNTPARRGKNVTPVTSSGSNKRNASVSKTNINKRNPKGETQLHLACKRSNFAAMSELIAAGADLNAQDNAGWTPLHDSVFSDNIEVIKFLLENGAKVNAPGLENTTALHEAIAKENVQIVKLLLKFGADVKAMNIFKETPLDLATKYRLEEMKEILMKASEAVDKKPEAPTEALDQKLVLYKYRLAIEDEKLVNKFVEKFQGEAIPSLLAKDPPSHIIASGNKIEVSWALISAVPNGCWAVSIDWVKDSLKENAPKPPGEYALRSLPGFSKGRVNKLNQLPGLFTGCHFFFGGNFDCYAVQNMTIGKEDLKKVVEMNGGSTLKRCPDPESLALEKTVPFHAPSASSLRETSYFIIYQTEKWDPKPRYNMSHMKTLPVEWLVCCLLRFELIDPADNGFSWRDVLELR